MTLKLLLYLGFLSGILAFTTDDIVSCARTYIHIMRVNKHQIETKAREDILMALSRELFRRSILLILRSLVLNYILFCYFWLLMPSVEEGERLFLCLPHISVFSGENDENHIPNSNLARDPFVAALSFYWKSFFSSTPFAFFSCVFFKKHLELMLVWYI